MQENSNKVSISSTKKEEKAKAIKVKFKNGKEVTIVMKGVLSELFYRTLNALYAKDSDYSDTYSLEMKEGNEMDQVDTKTNEDINPTIITIDGKEYKVTGALEDALKTFLQTVQGTGTATESEESGEPVIYCVRIDQVEQSEVDEFAGLVGNAKLVLFAINPGKAKRTTSMEAMERLAEENDICIYHDLDALDHFVRSKEVKYEYQGPIANIVQKVLGEETNDNQEELDNKENVSE